MEIKVLSENTAAADNFASEFGLSFFIKCAGKNILFDTGGGTAFQKNAEILGVDLSKTEYAVLSHGHSDHGGGLERYFEINRHAKVYAGEGATGDFYAKRADETFKYIGLPEAIKSNPRLVFCGEFLEIDKNVSLFCARGEEFVPSGNNTLYRCDGERFVLDDFSNERHLALTENNVTLLICGCGHQGIVNIMKTYRDRFGAYPDYVLGGFHLYNAGIKVSEAPEIVQIVANFLKTTGSTFFTGHCTGNEAYDILYGVFGKKIKTFSAGMVITI